MVNALKILGFIVGLFMTAVVSAASSTVAPSVTLQLLGTGGPNAIDGRASAGYLVWIDGKARIMIDAGGGASLRFGEAGADMSDLQLLALSHLHADHSVDTFTLIKRGYFYKQTHPLLIAGPTGNDEYASLETFLSSGLNPKDGSFSYMSEYFDYKSKMLDATNWTTPVLVWASDDAKVTAIGVEHATTPAFAYRVDTARGSMAFSGDQNGRTPEFPDFIKDVDILVMHFPNEERTDPSKTFWHASPGTIGKIAQKANVKTLVLSHFMEYSLANLEENIAIVREHFKGNVVLGTDLMKFDL